MFDSIRCNWTRILDLSRLGPGWQVKRFTSPQDLAGFGQAEQEVKARYTHKGTGLMVCGDGTTIRFFQVSLPRILFGTNGHLIKNAAELKAAMQRLTVLLNEISEPYGPISHFTRADLAWQFRGDPRQWSMAFRNARHNRLRADAVVFHDSGSVNWRGTELRIRIYDKMLQLKQGSGDVIRLEFQLTGGLLKELLGDADDKVSRLDFDRGYQAFRELALGLQPNPAPTPSGIAGIIALVDSTGWTHNGLSLFDHWSVGRNREHVRQMQRRLAGMRPNTFNINFHELLPADGPPPAIDLQLPEEALP